MKIGEMRSSLYFRTRRGVLHDCSKLVIFYRGKFNPEMMGEEIDENTRSIFPVEPDDDIVLADTKEWVQRGDHLDLKDFSALLSAGLLLSTICQVVTDRLTSES